LRLLHSSLLTALLISGGCALAENNSTSSTSPAPTVTANIQLKPFEAHYTSTYKLGFLSFDIDARRQLTELDNNTWQLDFSASASAASLDERSRFQLIDGVITPLKYTLEGSGLIQEDDRALSFNAETGTIHDSLNDKEYRDQWQEGLQDKLTYMLQVSLDIAAGKQNLDYPVFEKNKLKNYRFEIIGEEILTTRIGPLKTIKIRQVRKDKRDISAWLAIDKQYLLVKLVDKDNNHKRYEIDLVSITP
jgi:hypothetical protein